MKKIKILLITLTLTIFTVLSGCNEQKFDGSKTGNDNQFILSFKVLNTTLESEMPLSKEDVIKVVIEIEKGKVDIVIKNDIDTVAYRGNDVENSNFNVEITETGTYTFYVTGYKAKGYISFVKMKETN